MLRLSRSIHSKQKIKSLSNKLIQRNKKSRSRKTVALAEKMTMSQETVNQTNNENVKRNLIQVSNTKKPLFFYVNLAKRYLQQHKEIELSALGMAITTVVTIAEILKNNGFATEKSISTCTAGMKDETKGRVIHKARIIIVLEKSEKFDSLMAATGRANANGKVDDNNNNNNNNSSNNNDKKQ